MGCCEIVVPEERQGRDDGDGVSTDGKKLYKWAQIAAFSSGETAMPGEEPPFL